MKMTGKPDEEKISDEDFDKAKAKAETIYKGFTAVHCPYLKKKVIFNTSGFDHIKFKGWEKPRSKPDQYVRFKLINLIPTIVGLSHTVQGNGRQKHGNGKRSMGSGRNQLKTLCIMSL